VRAMGRRACIGIVVSALGAAVLSTALAATLAAPGQLDGAFGANGKVTTDVGGADWAGSAAIAPGGALVVAGGSDRDAVVARYDAAGRLDPSFGAGGTVVTDLGGDEAAEAVVVQSDGRVVVAGQRNGDLAVVRYSSEGALDPGFDGDGVVVTDLGFEERSLSALQAPGGRLLVVGSAADRLVLARYRPDGRLDPGFGRGGTIVTPTPGLDWRMAVRARDGTIVVAGARVVTRPTQAMGLAVARYRSDGRLDRTFARDGLVVTRARPHWAGAVKVAVRGDGRIVLGTHGHAGLGSAGFALVRLRRDGALDRAFGDGGISVSEVGYGVHALALDRQGRIVTVGRTSSLLDFVAARFHPDGRRDRTFAATVTNFGGVDTPFAVAIQPDGRIVAVGASAPSGSLVGDIALARYLASG
jgi:uncharacterized delta-60 repeat protein